MPIGTTNIKLSDLQTEYGGTNPISLSEYYRGGSFVPTAPANGTTSPGNATYVVSNSTTSIPTSGAIRIDNFKNTAKNVTISITITAIITNFDLLAAIYATLGSFSAPINCTCTINTGVVVYSTNSGIPAFTTGTGWPAGSSLTIVNNGFIIGMGGAGGGGGSFSNGAAGGAGGTALSLTIATTINNLGYIWGGGGGGGGGGSAGYFSGTYYSGGGGGGGGESYETSAGGGAGGQVNLYTQFRAPTAGGNGINGAGGGAGGVGGQQGEDITGKGKPPPVTRLIYGQGGDGGAGGSYGAAGTTGGNGIQGAPPNQEQVFTFLYGSNGAGAGGYYLIKNGNAATWINFGNRLGTEV